MSSRTVMLNEIPIRMRGPSSQRLANIYHHDRSAPDSLSQHGDEDEGIAKSKVLNHWNHGVPKRETWIVLVVKIW